MENLFLKYLDDDKVLSEIAFNLKDFSGIREHSPKASSLIWGFDNFICKITHTGDNEWVFKFGMNNGENDLDAKSLELTGEFNLKKTASIISNVAKCFILFLRKAKPRRIIFSGNSRGRKNLYKRLVITLYKEEDVMNYEQCRIIPDGVGAHFIIERKPNV